MGGGPHSSLHKHALTSLEIAEIRRCALTMSVRTLRAVPERSTQDREQRKIAIVIGSTRPDRIAATVGEWACEFAGRRDDGRFATLDVALCNLLLVGAR